MSARFFNPWIGGNYSDGMGSNGYCVLVLGASLYCDQDGKRKERCQYFDECTNGDIKDSSAFNDRCPFWCGALLEKVLDFEDSPTMTRFKKKMKKRFGHLLDGDEIWDRTAFAEYVQYYLDHEDTYYKDLSDRDFDAFLETLDELRPDVVIVWGKLDSHVVAKTLRNSEYTVEAEDDDPWDFAWEYEDMFIRFICCTHPASRGNFYIDFPEFARKFEETINDDNDNDEDDVHGDDSDDYEADEDEEEADDDDAEEYEDDEEDESDDEEEDEDEEDDDCVVLETANDLLERLDELPKKCDGFTVRFRAVNSGDWVQPERWYMDGEHGNLILCLFDDGENHDDDELTVRDLKNILTGGELDNDDHVVWEDTPVLIDDMDSDDLFVPLDEYFHIRWKQRLVVIPVTEDGDDDEEDSEEDSDEDEAYDSDDEHDDEGDEDDDMDEEDEEYDEDDDESDEEDGDEFEEDYAGEEGVDEEDYDDDQSDEDDDEEEERDEECGEDGNGGNRPPCDLMLGLIMERGFQNWLHGK